MLELLYINILYHSHGQSAAFLPHRPWGQSFGALLRPSVWRNSLKDPLHIPYPTNPNPTYWIESQSRIIHPMRFAPLSTAFIRWAWHPFPLATISPNYHQQLQIEYNFLSTTGVKKTPAQPCLQKIPASALENPCQMSKSAELFYWSFLLYKMRD